jgi:small multidrug resistance family-3 protein
VAGEETVSLAVILRTAGLFGVTALSELLGCYLPYLWLRKAGSAWLLVPGALSLVAFVWLLSLHPAASGRVYAAYGAVYVVAALVWIRAVDGSAWTHADWIGASLALLGMAIMVAGWRTH